jgi:Tol biopolymer transport system component
MQVRKSAIHASFLVLSAATTWGQLTQRVSLSATGQQGMLDTYFPSITPDGRFVAFNSVAPNLVPGDTDYFDDVFVRDRQNGTLERVSVSSSGVQGNDNSSLCTISADGRYVAFMSVASNLVPGDTNGTWDIFVRDRLTNTTERVSITSSGSQANAFSYDPSISADGRYVAFQSMAFNLVPGDTNGAFDVFVRDRQLGTTERVSVDSSGLQADGASYAPRISADGRYVSFESAATNLVSGDTNGTDDIFVRDLLSGTTERVSVSFHGTQGNGLSYGPSISSDGRFVAFASLASNLVLGDTNNSRDVFVRDRSNGTTELVSVDSSGAQGDGDSDGASISADGRCVAFASTATNLVSGDTNGTSDVFLRDRQLGTTERVSVSSTGLEGNDYSYFPSTAGDGRFVAFNSRASNLVAGDTNGYSDDFVRDRNAAGFGSLCDPGSSGVLACPCSNTPGGPGRGCDNSAATGGAILAASGVAYLSMDSLVFTASAEKPTATSIVMQGNAVASGGLVFGQGVRCVGGSLKRLYTTTASSGSITAPDFGVGDPTVSSRSAALGDLISAGQSRWYLVYYRDPIVLGGCPASSTFNATQTARIDWSF